MSIVRIISFTEAGYQLSCKMQDCLQERAEVVLYSGKNQVAERHAEVCAVSDGLKNWCSEVFDKSEVLIFVGACGIAVRTIAPFVNSKCTDPAVLVADEQGKHIISLLSGHLGGGNQWTLFLAQKLQADPVITTASDVNEYLAVDVWAKQQMADCRSDAGKACGGSDCSRRKNCRFMRKICRYKTCQKELNLFSSKESFQKMISKRAGEPIGGNCCFDIRSLAEKCAAACTKRVILGIGCRKEKDPAEVETQVRQVLENYHVAVESIAKLVSIDLKAEEAGILRLAERWGIPFETFSTEELQLVPGTFAESEFVKKTTGVGNVCERAAVAALPEESTKATMLESVINRQKMV